MADVLDIKALENQYSSGIYAKRDITITRGQGAVLFDDHGKAYIDCVGGQGTANLGHAHPLIVQAITQQAAQLISCPEMFYNVQRAQFLARMGQLVPGLDRVFLCNSGTEAVEAALKMARFSTQRLKFIATMRGFHGRSMGALSATWEKKYRAPFEPLIQGFSHVPYHNLDAMEAALDDDTAAVILEVVQGEGGVFPGSADYLEGVQQLCREHGALLILDEVQTGFGRTGKLFAFQHYALQPDLVCLAKSIAGGFPMGALLIGERVAELQPGIHGSTFGGNPLACAAGLAALDVQETEHLADRAAEMGAYFKERLEEINSPMIREVRGLGLMLGIEIKQKVAPYLAALVEKGVLALPAGLTVIRLLPPLVISREQIDQVVAALSEVLAQ